MIKKSKRICFLILMILVLGNCSQRIYDLKAGLKLSNNYAIAGNCISIDLLFDLGTNERLNFNGFVFLKFYNATGGVEFMDVHRPPYKMTEWVPGSRIKYSKCIEIPGDIPEGEYKISLGIYNPTENFKKIRIINPLFIDGESYMGKISIIKIYDYSGFYGLEKMNCSDIAHRWISKEATAYIRNPRRDIILLLRLSAPPNYFSGSYQKTKIFINRNLIDTIEFNSGGIVNKEYKIKADLIGKEKFVELKFISDKEFIPKNLGLSQDNRNLSVMLHAIEFNNEN